MRPSYIGVLATMILVPLAAAMASKYRGKRAAGDRQRYPAAAWVLLSVLSLGLLGGAIVFAVQESANWLLVAVLFILAFVLGGAAVYYYSYVVTASNQGIEIEHPLKGTISITRENIVKVEWTSFRSVPLVNITFEDAGNIRKVTLDPSRFDLSSFLVT